MAQQVTVHEMVGGDSFFVALVDDFYDRVAADDLLRPLYPADLSDSRAFLAGFLIQYWGGSTAYSDERGHPRLRMRHQPFAIGIAERDAWFTHMEAALLAREAELPASVVEAMVEYFDRAATAMINVAT